MGLRLANHVLSLKSLKIAINVKNVFFQVDGQIGTWICGVTPLSVVEHGMEQGLEHIGARLHGKDSVDYIDVKKR